MRHIVRWTIRPGEAGGRCGRGTRLRATEVVPTKNCANQSRETTEYVYDAASPNVNEARRLLRVPVHARRVRMSMCKSVCMCDI